LGFGIWALAISIAGLRKEDRGWQGGPVEVAGTAVRPATASPSSGRRRRLVGPGWG